jgi:hypothetical protein
VSDLVQKIKDHVDDRVEQALRPDLLADAVKAALERHSEYPPGWCVNCGRDYPCMTVTDMAEALGVREDPED